MFTCCIPKVISPSLTNKNMFHAISVRIPICRQIEWFALLVLMVAGGCLDLLSTWVPGSCDIFTPNWTTCSATHKLSFWPIEKLDELFIYVTCPPYIFSVPIFVTISPMYVFPWGHFDPHRFISPISSFKHILWGQTVTTETNSR